MKKTLSFLLILICVFTFRSFGQAYLGKEKKEIVKELKKNQTEYEFEMANEKLGLLTFSSSGEVVHLVLVDNVCSEYVISKPYSLASFSNEVLAFNESYEKIDKLKWRSKDRLHIFEITVNNIDYNVSMYPIN